jgi:DnaJ like chaperone protein
MFETLQRHLSARRWWGKVIGALLGLAVKGPLGAVIGAIVGHQFDRGLLDALRAAGNPGAIEGAFFETTFSVMGHVAKSDGRVSENEIQLARAVMQRFDLTDDRRQAAMRLFTAGKQPGFPLDKALARLRRACAGNERLLHQFVEIQVAAMLADRRPHPQTRQLLWRICEQLGLGRVDLAQMEAAAHARSSGHMQQGGLPSAYKVLGVNENADDATVKTAYRRLMNRHHPDKLAARGLPKEMLNEAREQTQAIQAAWEQVKASRGLR